MLTRFKSKFKKVLSKKFIFQNELYQINLDKKTFNIFGVKCNFRKKLFNQSFSNLSMLFQTDKASFIHRVTPNLPSKEYTRTITQSHDYAKYYDKLFFKKKSKVKNICEIGIMSGASTAAFYFFFPKSKLFSLDIDFRRFSVNSKRVIKKYFDQSDLSSINKFKKETKNVKFDLIVDDGSHVDEHIILTFKNLISKVKKNGFYVIEDASEELTPNIIKIINNFKFKKLYKIRKIYKFKSEEGLELENKDGTKKNYIFFIQKK